MCSVLEFSSESDKLRTLFSESNHFDSVLFIFDGGRRYKVSSSSLGIHSPQDLLLPLGLGLFRSSPFWSYYLYPQGCNFHKGIDGLCGEVIRHTGSCVSEQSCHIFPDRSRSRLHILYRCDDEYRLECRRLNRGSFLLKKEERKKDFLQISWNRLSCLLLKSIGKQLKSNSPFYKPCSFILITLPHNKKWMYSERTGYYPYFGRVRRVAQGT